MRPGRWTDPGCRCRPGGGRRGRPVERPAEEPHPAAVGVEKPRQDRQQRRLPGPVGAEQAEELARLDGKRNAVQGDGLPVTLADVRDFENRRRHGAIIVVRPHGSSVYSGSGKPEDQREENTHSHLQRRPHPPGERQPSELRRQVRAALDAGGPPAARQPRPRLRPAHEPAFPKAARGLRGSEARLPLGQRPAPRLPPGGDAGQRRRSQAPGPDVLAVRRDAGQPRPRARAEAGRGRLPGSDGRLPGVHRPGPEPRRWPHVRASPSTSWTATASCRCRCSARRCRPRPICGRAFTSCSPKHGATAPLAEPEVSKPAKGKLDPPFEPWKPTADLDALRRVPAARSVRTANSRHQGRHHRRPRGPRRVRGREAAAVRRRPQRPGRPGPHRRQPAQPVPPPRPPLHPGRSGGRARVHRRLVARGTQPPGPVQARGLLLPRTTTSTPSSTKPSPGATWATTGTPEEMRNADLGMRNCRT